MLGTLPKAEIAARVKALNLTANCMARRCGLASSTLMRGPNTLRSYRKVTDALAAEELRLLAHLAALYPQEAMAAATVALCPERPIKQEAAE